LRQSTKFILQKDPELQVVGEASNGEQALALVKRLQPQVVTMDIRMPKMDGLEAIREIMAEQPVPIVVVTSVDLDQETDLAAQARRLGAVAVLRRPTGIATADYEKFATRLIEQVKLLSTLKVIHRSRSARTTTGEPCQEPPPASAPARKIEIVAIGASTGGPAALHQILSQLPADFPAPIVIVQHISFGFVEGLASWLDDACPLHVKVAQQGERLHAGNVYLAPDNHHMLVDRFNQISLAATEPVGGHRPAVTVLFQSVAQAYGAAALAVILTGMGADGAVGMQALRHAGAMTLAQDQASCVVFGMPKEAIALGAIQQIVPLGQIAQTLQQLVVV